MTSLSSLTFTFLFPALPLVSTVRGQPWTQRDCFPCQCMILPQSTFLQYRRVKFANCSSRNLQEIPASLPHDIEELDLGDNDLRIALRTNYNNLWKYDATKTLYLGGARLTHLPSDLFKNATKLQYLDLMRQPTGHDTV